MDALTMVRNKVFASANGARTDVKKLLIIITDSIGSADQEMMDISNELRSQGISFLVIGVGTKVDKTVITKMAGSSLYAATAATTSELTTKKFVQKMYISGGEAGMRSFLYLSVCLSLFYFCSV